LAKDRLEHKLRNILLVLVGPDILWNDWNGFNGGDPYAASPHTGSAVLNTNIATAMSALVWIMWDTIYYKKTFRPWRSQRRDPSLVSITPAGVVAAGWGAIVIGIVSGSVSWVMMNIAGKKLSLFHHVDDTLGVFHTHLVAGAFGGFLVSIFSTS
jgi:ammonium transporter, Amt family